MLVKARDGRLRAGSEHYDAISHDRERASIGTVPLRGGQLRAAGAAPRRRALPLHRVPALEVKSQGVV